MSITLLLVSLGLAGCDGITDDLKPSADDNRLAVEEGTIGTQVGQQSPDFSVLDTLGISRGLYDELTNANGVVLYFTMWCPICFEHMDHMRNHVIPDFPDVTFFLVDYVSGSVSTSRATQLLYGYGDIDTLVDYYEHEGDELKFLETMYEGTMGTTIVIDSLGIVHMNEDYKDGVKLIETLQALP
jgi:peroxiredoxin